MGTLIRQIEPYYAAPYFKQELKVGEVVYVDDLWNHSYMGWHRVKKINPDTIELDFSADSPIDFTFNGDVEPLFESINPEILVRVTAKYPDLIHKYHNSEYSNKLDAVLEIMLYAKDLETRE